MTTKRIGTRAQSRLTGRRIDLCVRPLAALVCACVLSAAVPAKGVKKGDAQKAIAAAPPFALNSGAVAVKEIESTETAATVRAGVRVAFRFERDAGGAWRVAQVRTGDRQWEEFALLASAVGAQRLDAARAALEAFAAELDAQARAAAERKAADEREDERDPARPGARASSEPARAGGDSPADEKSSGKSGGEKSSGRGKTAAPPEEVLVRGPLSVKKPEAALAAMGSSAVVEAEIDATFTLARERGKWRVTSARVGQDAINDFGSLLRALDAAKAARARTELDALASALEAYRRERGFYVAADTASALLDHLNPKFTPLFIRFDPWHRPYEYEGTPARFRLRSLGPDGKPDTADDVSKSNAER